jgi:hypothetical protein
MDASSLLRLWQITGRGLLLAARVCGAPPFRTGTRRQNRADSASAPSTSQRQSIERADFGHQNINNNAGFASKNPAVRFRMAS